MSKKQKTQEYVPMEVAPAVRQPRVVFKLMNNSAPVPVARPADFIQLTPVIQPVALVPYSTQMQPMAMFDDEN